MFISKTIPYQSKDINHVQLDKRHHYNFSQQRIFFFLRNAYTTHYIIIYIFVPYETWTYNLLVSGLTHILPYFTNHQIRSQVANIYSWTRSWTLWFLSYLHDGLKLELNWKPDNTLIRTRTGNIGHEQERDRALE